MTEGHLVVNEILSFVTHKYAQVADLQLIEIMRHFYDIQDLYLAKMKLIEDVDKLHGAGRRPHITTQPPLAKQVSMVIEYWTYFNLSTRN